MSFSRMDRDGDVAFLDRNVPSANLNSCEIKLKNGLTCSRATVLSLHFLWPHTNTHSPLNSAPLKPPASLSVTDEHRMLSPPVPESGKQHGSLYVLHTSSSRISVLAKHEISEHRTVPNLSRHHFLLLSLDGFQAPLGL